MGLIVIKDNGVALLGKKNKVWHAGSAFQVVTSDDRWDCAAG